MTIRPFAAAFRPHARPCANPVAIGAASFNLTQASFEFWPTPKTPLRVALAHVTVHLSARPAPRLPILPTLVLLNLVEVPDRSAPQLNERLGEVAREPSLGEGRLRDPEQLGDFVHAAQACWRRAFHVIG